MRRCPGNTDLWLSLGQIQPCQSLLHQVIQPMSLTSLLPSGTVVKNPPASAGDARDAGLIPGLKRFPGVQVSSVAQSCPTLCHPVNHSTPGLPVHHQLPESTQTHVHRVSDAIQPSHPLPSPSPPAPNPSHH